MKPVWAVLLLLLAPLAGSAAEPLPAWTSANKEVWWTRNPAPAQWTQAAADLRAQLDAAYQKNGATVFSQPDFQGWMEHLEWIQLGLGASDLLAKPENLQTFIALGQDDKLSHQLVEKMVPGDVPSAALALLIKLAQAGMADLHEYNALGIAYCLVFDGPFPGNWPHAQVAQSAVPIGDLDVVPRFQFYVAANRAKKLERDLTRDSFENLKFLVDSEVSLSELQYGQTDTSPYSDFVQAFFEIKYDHMRVSAGNDTYDWDHPSYLLKEINAVGGICVDQAYYACEVGKARGIPTIFFTGQGDDGGHAWFGYLDRSGKWELDCGRYEQQNYAKGYARDPQTWEVMKDTDLQQVMKNRVGDPNHLGAETALAWARLHGNAPAAKQIYEDAHTIMPTLAETWRAEADYLDANGASIDDQKAFYQDWITQMGAYPDLKVNAQRRLLAELRKANDPSADSVEQDIILQNRTGGIDLAVQGSSDAIDERLKANDWDGARLQFEKSVRDFGEKGGGTFFYNVVRPYVRACTSAGLMDQAGKAIQFTEDRSSENRVTWRGKSVLNADFDNMKDRFEKEKAGLAAMQAWLGEIDSGHADQAWSEASDVLQKAVSADKWNSDITAERQKWGSLVSRKLAALDYHDQFRMASGELIKADFIEAHFETAFDSQPIVIETVSFKKSAGKWQAFAYDSREPK